MSNLIFYPYQLEDGSYIDKVTGKAFSNNGVSILKYPVNMTPYKTSKNYLGGGGMYKTSANQALIIYIENYRLLDKLTDFTIYFWQKSVAFGTILTFDDTGGGQGSAITNVGMFYDGAGYGIGSFTLDTSIWSFCEYTFKKSSSSNYIVTCFYQGKKKFTGNLNVNWLKKSCTILGSWSYAPRYGANGFTGYVYDLSIYDEILHTENYDKFPYREMDPGNRNEYKGLQNKNDMYGMI